MILRTSWSSYRAHGLGQPDSRLTPHPLYIALGGNDEERRDNDRALFRSELDCATVDDIRLARNQNHPIGNERFHAKIEAITGIRRQARPRGRPRKNAHRLAADPTQGRLEL